MIETPQVKAAQGTERSAANGYKLDPDDIAKVGPSHYLKTGLLITRQVVCIPYGATSECMDSRARLAVRTMLRNNGNPEAVTDGRLQSGTREMVAGRVA